MKPIPPTVPEINIKRELKRISKLPRRALASGDRAVGFTLEELMGVKENNRRNHDFTYQSEFVELKAHSRDANTPITLFTKEPLLRRYYDVDLIEAFGYIDKEKRKALKIECHYRKPEHELELDVDENPNFLKLMNKKTGLIWRWPTCDFEDLKFKNLLLVFADRTKTKRGVLFHYNEAWYLKGFKESKFLELIKNDHIFINLRMHIEKKGGKKKSRNHGTAFRIRDGSLDDFMQAYHTKVRIL